MPLVANVTILENVHTTAEWIAIPTLLPDRVMGHETDGSGNFIGTKIGNGVDVWIDLPYLYGGIPLEKEVIDLPAGSSIPFIYDMSTSALNKGFIAVSEMIDPVDDANATIINDIIITKNYTNSSRTVITSLSIQGHPGDTGTLDDVVITLYPV